MDVLFFYVLLSIITLILLLLCIKVVLLIEYEEELKFEVRWLFFRYKVFPAKKEKEKAKDSPKEENEKTKKPETKKKEKSNIINQFYHNQGFEGVLELIQNTVSSVTGALKRIYKAFIIQNLNLCMRITGDDSAKTAINYGIICSSIYPATGTLFSTMRFKKYNIDISPDFLGNANRAYFNAVVTVTPIRLTNAAIIFLFEFLFRVMIKLFFGSRPVKKKNKTREADKS